MRNLLMCSAFILATAIGLVFLDGPEHQLPFTDRHVVILAGGRAGDTFHYAVANGAVRAYQDLGCTINITCTTWDPSEVRTRFQQAMAGVPDAICIVGDPRDAQLLPLIESAIEGGIVVTSYQREMPQAQERFGADGFGFAGPDFYGAGQALIDAAVKKHRLAPGAAVLLLHDPQEKEEGGLFDGAMAALQIHGLAVEPVEIVRGQSESVADVLKPRLKAAIGSGMEPALICSLNASLETCLRTLNESGIEPHRLPLVGVRVGDDIRGTIEPGKTHLSLLLEQDIALQAYLAVLQACRGKEYAAVGSRVLTPFTIVDCDLPAAGVPPRQPENFILRF